MSEKYNNEIEQRMNGMMAGIDNAMLLLKEREEYLMMACAMMQRSKEIFDAVLGEKGRKIMFEDYTK